MTKRGVETWALPHNAQFLESEEGSVLKLGSPCQPKLNSMLRLSRCQEERIKPTTFAFTVKRCAAAQRRLRYVMEKSKTRVTKAARGTLVNINT